MASQVGIPKFELVAQDTTNVSKFIKFDINTFQDLENLEKMILSFQGNLKDAIEHNQELLNTIKILKQGLTY